MDLDEYGVSKVNVGQIDACLNDEQQCVGLFFEVPNKLVKCTKFFIYQCIISQSLASFVILVASGTMLHISFVSKQAGRSLSLHNLFQSHNNSARTTTTGRGLID